MHGRAREQYFFRSYSIYFYCYTQLWKSLHTPVRKRKQKGLKVLNLALLFVVFKRRHGSEGVNDDKAGALLFSSSSSLKPASISLPDSITLGSQNFSPFLWFCQEPQINSGLKTVLEETRHKHLSNCLFRAQTQVSHCKT